VLLLDELREDAEVDPGEVLGAQVVERLAEPRQQVVVKGFAPPAVP
jgi:hypothetical protein